MGQTKTPLHPSIREAQRQAEKLSTYRIMPAYHGVMLWRFAGRWVIDQPFSHPFAAEDCLFAKLPEIHTAQPDWLDNRHNPRP